MNIQKLYQDYGVDTPGESHKHFRQGWVQTECPFCSGNVGYHLGYNLQNNYFNCHRCGHKSPEQAVSKILQVTFREAKALIKQYKGRGTKKQTKVSVKKKTFRMPEGITPICEGNPYVVRYMERNRKIPFQHLQILQGAFGLFSSGTASYFKMDSKKKMDLRYRVIAPIYFNDEIVSWQSRDTTETSKIKYLTCPGEFEKREHKTLIYHQPFLKKIPKTIVLSEGIFDVWSIFLAGYFAGCGFGVELTVDQIYLLKKNFKRVLIFMDPDKAGTRKAKEIFNQLAFSGVICEVVRSPYKSDPGDLNKDQIHEVLKPYF